MSITGVKEPKPGIMSLTETFNEARVEGFFGLKVGDLGMYSAEYGDGAVMANSHSIARLDKHGKTEEEKKRRKSTIICACASWRKR